MVAGQINSGVLIDKDGVQFAVFKKICDIYSGFYLDSLSTIEKAGIGIAKEVFKNREISLDTGIYAITNYNELFAFKPNIGIGVGVSLKF